jgi:predicted ATPase
MVSPQFISRISLRRDIVESFDNYPFSLPAARMLDHLEMHPKITYLVGDNGSGKSTLLEAIAVSFGFNAEGGSKNFNFGTNSTHSDLYRYLRIAKGFRKPRTGYFLRAESFYNVASEIDKLDAEPLTAPRIIDGYGGVSLHHQSHGESFMTLMTQRFKGQGLYILDEPEAALSPQRQLAVLSRMHDLVQQGSQFIIATHSAILMAYPESSIYQFSQDGIAPVAYEDTEHFQVSRDFLASPQRMLRQLLRD